MKKSSSFALSTLVVLLLLAQFPHVWPSTRSGMCRRVMLSDETRYRNLCPPQLVLHSQVLQLPLKIQCLLRCLNDANCLFFAVDDVGCSLWPFDLDPNYDQGNFDAPFATVYQIIKNSTSSPLDVALGKTVNSESTYPGYSGPSMLTGGTGCFRNQMEDCHCTEDNSNWLVVDLGTSLPITKIVVTGPGFGDNDFFADVIIRIGSNGDQTDSLVAKTPSSGLSDFQKFEYAVSAPDSRYIWMKPDNTAALCLCKIQAYL